MTDGRAADVRDSDARAFVERLYGAATYHAQPNAASPALLLGNGGRTVDCIESGVRELAGINAMSHRS
jgi:hypothetical protein